MIPSPFLAICKFIARWRLKRGIHRTIQAAFDTLDPLEQAVFYGHRIQNLSYRQLTEIQGVTVHEIMRSFTAISCVLDEKHLNRWQLQNPNLQ